MSESSLPLAVVVFASLWLASSLLVSLVYPAAGAVLPRPPRQRAALLLGLCVAPFFISLAITVLEFAPSANSFIAEHCHVDCGAHAPTVFNADIAWGLLVLAGVFAGRVLLSVCARVIRQRHLARMLNVVTAQSHRSFRVIDSPQPLAFSAGVFRPEVFVSRALVEQTTDAELQAIVEHERAHGLRRDNLRNWLAFACTFPSVPQKRLLADLSLAAEQCCDAAAARALRDPLLVAAVLIKVQRLQRGGMWREVCGFDGSNIETRINALLQPAQETAPVLLAMLFVGTLALIILAPNPLHHLIETVLDGLRLLSW